MLGVRSIAGKGLCDHPVRQDETHLKDSYELSVRLPYKTDKGNINKFPRFNHVLNDFLMLLKWVVSICDL
jgi:hypothetical protein